MRQTAILTTALRKNIGSATRWRLRLLREAWQFARTGTPTVRICNICGYVGCFMPIGRPIRSEAMCPECTSLERHRNLKLWFDKNSNLFATARVLHFAPEVCVTRFLRPACARYVTADLESGRCDLTLNIENIALPDHQFDYVICSHVLEHVDDRASLRELRRILRE
jgi:hypothetical protein